MRYTLRDNKAENDRFIDTEEGQIYNEARSMHYTHLNNIFAVYTSYAINIRKLSLKGGVRYEFNHQRVKYELGSGTDFTANFNDVVPSGSIGWKLSDKSNLVGAYSMRIARPGINYLNPYLNDNDPMNISQGNYKLESERIQSANVNYNLFTAKINLNLTLDYTFINNAIQSITTLVNDNTIQGLPNPTGTDVMYSTYDNIGKSKTTTLSGFFSWNIIKGSRIYTNFKASYLSLRAAELSNYGWTARIYGGFQQSFNHGWELSMRFFYVSPPVNLQGKGRQFITYGLGISKSFWDKKLTVNVRISNPFNKYSVFGERKQGADFSQENYFRAYRQLFGVRVTYRIGDLKASVKKAQKSIGSSDTRIDVGEGE